jgi:hypothetical protein
MVTTEENCERSREWQLKIWRYRKMNGTTSVVVTLNLPRVTGVSVTDDTLSVDLEDGRTVSVPIGWYPRLAHGTPAERENVQISGAGFGLHWPDLDEDIGIEGILLGKPSNESPQSLEKWLKGRKQ